MIVCSCDVMIVCKRNYLITEIYVDGFFSCNKVDVPYPLALNWVNFTK